MAKKLFVVLLLGFVAALAGCWWFAERPAADEGDGYTLVPVEYGRAADSISVTGVAQPRDVYLVGSELAGRVVEVRADFNQEVAEGDLLARLDDRDVRERMKQAELGVQEAQAGLRQAESARDAASTAVQRVKEQSSEIRRQIDLDVVQHQFTSAEAGVEAARIKVQLAEETRRRAADDVARTEIRARSSPRRAERRRASPRTAAWGRWRRPARRRSRNRLLPSSIARFPSTRSSGRPPPPASSPWPAVWSRCGSTCRWPRATWAA